MKCCKHLTLFVLMLAISAACNEYDPQDRDHDAKTYLRENYMDVYYYWNREVKQRNAKLSPGSYDIYSFFNAMLYKDDRWSWMEDASSYVSSSTGTISGGTYAVSMTQAIEDFGDYRLWVRYIYPGSPLERFGVTRGAQMTGIAGVDITDGFRDEAQIAAYTKGMASSPQTFSFRLADGRDTTFTTEWSTRFVTDYVLVTKVFTAEDYAGLGQPVGYINYLSFNRTHIPSLSAALKSLKEKGVRKLILDLRYNGGGDADASDSLMSYIAPRSAAGKAYVSRIHNELLAGKGYDITQTVAENAGNLDLDEVYFIMGGGSASASEMVYNGIRPYMGNKVHLVGRNTYGKPNGMYVLMYPGDKESRDRYDKRDYAKLEYVFYPICFFNVNSKGEMIPESGFVPEDTGPDDIYHDFDVNDRDINACLHHIVNGAYPATKCASAAPGSGISSYGTIVSQLLPEEKANPHYGTYKVHLDK